MRRQCNDDDNDESYNESSVLGSVMCLCVDGCGCVVEKSVMYGWTKYMLLMLRHNICYVNARHQEIQVLLQLE